MLGRLGMDVDDCIEQYISMFETVFGHKAHSIPVNLKGEIKSKFSSDVLRTAFTKVVTKCGLAADTKFNDGEKRDCHTQV